MEGNLYRSIGLPLTTWRLLDQARTSRLCRDVFGVVTPTDSQVLAWMMRMSLAKISELEQRENEVLA
jgi:hypothetical protein